MDKTHKIAIGSDHAGFNLKETIREHLESTGLEVVDYGTYSPDSVDYPDFAHKVSAAVESDHFEFGVLICGTANGIAMAANKHANIRAAVVWTESIAKMARLHNNANIICLPARVIADQLAKDCVDVFLATEFEGGRHERRVNKIPVC